MEFHNGREEGRKQGKGQEDGGMWERIKEDKKERNEKRTAEEEKKGKRQSDCALAFFPDKSTNTQEYALNIQTPVLSLSLYFCLPHTKSSTQ